ncbi:MAG: SCP2 sterol-binding domain-containing protein [Promethearchaeota archaeon]
MDPITDETKPKKLNKEEKTHKKKNKKKKLLGFPSVIWNQLQILNDFEPFKTQFADEHIDILIISTDDRRAAIVHIHRGNIVVEQVKTKPELLNPVKKQIKPRITTDTTTFLGLAMGKVNPVKALLKGKLKVKKLKVVLKFTKTFSLIKAAHRQRKQQEREMAKE